MRRHELFGVRQILLVLGIDSKDDFVQETSVVLEVFLRG
jgi:hypothetical protein